MKKLIAVTFFMACTAIAYAGDLTFAPYSNFTGAVANLNKAVSTDGARRVTVQPVFGNATGAIDIYGSLDGTNKVLLKTYSTAQTGYYSVPAIDTLKEIDLVWRSKETAVPKKPFTLNVRTSDK